MAAALLAFAATAVPAPPAAGVAVGAGGMVPVAADSGVALKLGKGVPKRDPNNRWWGAVRAGEPADRLVNWSKAASVLLLPPGRYDLYWKQGYKGKPAAFARGVRVSRGAMATVAYDGPEERSQVAADETAAKIARLSKNLGAGGSTSRLAAMSLGKMGAPAIPALTKALGDERGLVREMAADGLRRMSDDAFRDPGTDAGAVLKALLVALHDDYGNTGFNAARALPHLGAPAVPPLIEALSDDVSWVRWRAAYALGRIKPPPVAAVPALTAALGDENSDVRLLSAEALGTIGPAARSAAPELERLRDDGKASVRKAAAKALARLAKDR